MANCIFINYIKMMKLLRKINLKHEQIVRVFENLKALKLKGI